MPCCRHCSCLRATFIITISTIALYNQYIVFLAFIVAFEPLEYPREEDSHAYSVTTKEELLDWVKNGDQTYRDLLVPVCVLASSPSSAFRYKSYADFFLIILDFCIAVASVWPQPSANRSLIQVGLIRPGRNWKYIALAPSIAHIIRDQGTFATVFATAVSTAAIPAIAPVAVPTAAIDFTAVAFAVAFGVVIFYVVIFIALPCRFIAVVVAYFKWWGRVCVRAKQEWWGVGEWSVDSGCVSGRLLGEWY
ncbi:hypothetical protein EDB85DRAFT_1898792 [Lactarius pseudohatsudake]|nr:hypothetical protein EDB85DRAFT_1898792 [Lactarius pseudohatsudake]